MQLSQALVIPSSSTGLRIRPAMATRSLMSPVARMRSTVSWTEPMMLKSVLPELYRSDNPAVSISDSPQPAPPLRLDRNREFGQIAPFAVHEIVHALQASLLFRPVRVIEKPADDQFGL